MRITTASTTWSEIMVMGVHAKQPRCGRQADAWWYSVTAVDAAGPV